MTVDEPRTKVALRFDLRSPTIGSPAVRNYQAALELAALADQLGFHYVQISEHHGAEDGYCPAPIPVAAAFAARSRQLRVRISALQTPLYHPIRLAEDLAVVDLLSAGRLEVVLGAGYRRLEFDSLGIDFHGRARKLVETVEVLQQAGSQGNVTRDGRVVRVTPLPTPGGPRLLLAGSSRASALRAARMGLDYVPQHPSLYEPYDDECRRLGREPGPRAVPLAYATFVADDPDEAWSYYGPHLLHDMNAYGCWLAEAGMTGSFTPATDLHDVRASGKYLVVTPEECVQRAAALGADGHLILHPLVAGASVDRASAMLELVGARVLPHLRAENLGTAAQ